MGQLPAVMPGAITYVHANPEDLAAGRDALAAIYRAGEPS